MSQSVHVCKICGKKFATFKAVCGHQRIHSVKRNRMEEDDDEIWGRCSVSASDTETSSESASSPLSLSFYVCKICGKRFENVRAVCGHMRIHSGKSNRTEDENDLRKIWGLEVSSEAQTLGSSLSLKESEIEQHEINEAALNFVILFERVYDLAAAIRHLPPGDDSMDLELIPMKEKFSHFSELISHLGFETYSTCRDVVPEALCSPLKCKIQKVIHSNNSSYNCRICGKEFSTFQAACGHQRIHSGKRNRMEDDSVLPKIWGLEEQHEMNEAAMSLVMFSQRVYGFGAFQMSQSVHVCKICGKKFATFKAVCGHQRIHSAKRNRMEEDDDEIWGRCSVSASDTQTSSESASSPLSQSFYVCKICGKRFENVRAVCGHMRIHSGKSNRTEDETLGSSLSLKESSFMSKIEQHEMYEAALNFVILSERVYDLAAAIRYFPPGDDSMDLELIPMKEKFSHFSELISHLGFETFSTWRDVVPEALCSPPKCKIQKVIHSNNSSYNCRICGKKFATFKAVCGHQRIHSGKSNRMGDDNGLLKIWGLEEQHEMNEAAMSLVMFSQRVYGFGAFESFPPVDDSMELELKPAQEKILHCVDSKLDLSECFKNSSTCTDFAQALPYPLRKKFQGKPQSNSTSFRWPSKTTQIG